MNCKNPIYALAVLAAVCLLTASCQQEQKQTGFYATKADSILFDLGKSQDYDKLLALTDSFEKTGELSEIDANRWRGVGYYYLDQLRKSEFYYKKVMDADIKSDKDKNIYFKSTRRLAEILVKKGEYEDGLRIAMETVSNMEKWGGYTPKDHAIMLKAIGCCQINLGREHEAATNYETAYRDYLQLLNGNDTIRQLNDVIMGTGDITLDYITTRHFDEALKWIERNDSVMKLRIEAAPDYNTNLIDEYQARNDINRAIILQGLGRTKEAAQAYKSAAGSAFGKTETGRLLAAEYLVVAGRYNEAADNYSVLDQYLKQHGIALTLDNIQSYLLPKLRANIGAGRRDSVTALSSFLTEELDSAIIQAKSNDAAELATIYNTQEKEAQIARQKADLNRQRLFGISVASMLILIFLVIYIYHRIKAQRKLAAKNAQLSTLNDQLSTLNSQLVIANARAEESSRMKTNFIQQISHEIRTPLNILSGYTQVITTPDMELDDETRQDINHQITENTNRITGLVNKMLELSDVSSSTVIERNDQVLAIQIAAQAAEDSGISTASHLNFDMKIDDEAAGNAMLTTNLNAATRALALILDNARKFTKQPESFGSASNTKVPVVSADESHPSPKNTAVLRLTLSPSPLGEVGGRHFLFIVEDTGIGVPQEEAEHIFDEFVQLNDYYHGTGIGLTVARSIARRLGGDVTLDTSYTGGARFVMSLPMSDNNE